MRFGVTGAFLIAQRLEAETQAGGRGFSVIKFAALGKA